MFSALDTFEVVLHFGHKLAKNIFAVADKWYWQYYWYLKGDIFEILATVHKWTPFLFSAQIAVLMWWTI